MQDTMIQVNFIKYASMISFFIWPLKPVARVLVSGLRQSIVTKTVDCSKFQKKLPYVTLSRLGPPSFYTSSESLNN